MGGKAQSSSPACIFKQGLMGTAWRAFRICKHCFAQFAVAEVHKSRSVPPLDVAQGCVDDTHKSRSVPKAWCAGFSGSQPVGVEGSVFL